MLSRRQFLDRSLQGASLLAVGTVVPQFLADTARAAAVGKDTILVVIEMSGGNDGLNTVIPYADDLYPKARPTLRVAEDQVIRIDDHVGLHPGLRALRPLLDDGQLAVVQGVGYPNPDRSHFESMDIWQSAEVGRKHSNTGWLARSVPALQSGAGIPAMQVGQEKLPLAMHGTAAGIVSINDRQRYRLNLAGTDKASLEKRKQLLQDLAQGDDGTETNPLLQFVERRQLETYTNLDRLEQLLRDAEGNDADNPIGRPSPLSHKLQLVARLIGRDFGTRVFYVNIDGFDTHSNQTETHRKLHEEVAIAVSGFFRSLQRDGHATRTVVMTFSEFGRRVQENGSRGTDHGAASCLFVAGPAVKGGAIGKHPSLADLDSGDLKFHTDFRQVYATLLDHWLGVDSRLVLGGAFPHLDLIKPRA